MRGLLGDILGLEGTFLTQDGEQVQPDADGVAVEVLVVVAFARSCAAQT